MNVINAYLDTMFSAYPQTPRMLEAKAELQTMMEDAYTAHIAAGASENEAVGKVITEFGNLDEVAPVLGIASDLAPGGGESAAEGEEDPDYPKITLERAQQYAGAAERTRWKQGIAVALFVLSPIPMFLLVALSNLSSASDEPGSLIIEGAGSIGMIPLLLIVAIGVMLLISRSRELRPFSDIAEGDFTGTPEVDAWSEQLVRTHDGRRSVALQIAVTLWILAAAPLFISTLLFNDVAGNQSTLFGLCLTLVIVAIGLLVFLPATWAWGVNNVLTATEDDWDMGEDPSSFFSVVAAVYWPLLVVIYLAWSFIWDAWDRSWIVWPIGAVLFGVLASGAGAWRAYRKNRSSAS